MKRSFILKRFPVRSTQACTLFELLVVMGLIGTLSFFLIGGMGGGSRAASLQSAQTIVANLITTARTKAIAAGQSSRVMIHVDPADGSEPRRYLRYVVVEVQTSTGWQTVTETFLPEGIYVVPGNFSSMPVGLFAVNAAPWTKSDGSDLRSTALRTNQVTVEMVNGSVLEQWASITFSSNAGTLQSGDIVLATGRQKSPGSYGVGDSPVELDNPENVRGLTLSVYGVSALINARTSF